MPRMNLTKDEADVIAGLRTEKNIYNQALADAVKAVTEFSDSREIDPIIAVILKLRKL